MSGSFTRGSCWFEPGPQLVLLGFSKSSQKRVISCRQNTTGPIIIVIFCPLSEHRYLQAAPNQEEGEGDRQMVDASKIGQSFPPFTIEVERGKVRELALAIGDENPVYQSRQAAQAEGYTEVPLYPT